MTRPTFTEADYPTILEAIQRTKTLTLDLTPAPEGADIFDEEMENKWYWLGKHGNLTSQAWCDIHGWRNQKELKKRFTTFVQEDGQIGITIKYYQAMPYAHIPKTVKKAFKKTKLNTLMTFEQFVEAVEEGDEWIEDCFGTMEIHEILFDVTAAGRESHLDDGNADKVLEDPLWITHQGKKYNVHVFLHED